MLKRTTKLLTMVAVMLLLTAANNEKRTTIFIIGDSTAANKDLSKGKQERGWGMALQNYFDDNIVVMMNHGDGSSDHFS